MAGLLCFMQIDKAIQIYLDWKSTHTHFASERYRVRLIRFAQFTGLTGNISDISGDDIVQYHRKMEKSDGYSLNTIAYSARILKNFFEFWRGRGVTTLNPQEIIPVRFISADKMVVSKDDLEDMSDVLDEHVFADLTKKLVLHLLWDTGMRVSELCELQIADIQEKTKGKYRTAKVRTRKSMRYNLVVWGEKTDKLLTKYLAIRLSEDINSDRLLVVPNKKDSDKVTTRTIQRWIKSVSEEAMLDKHITPHSFRHGKAHHMLDSGANVRDVQAILRHVNPQSSFHYMQLNPEKYVSIAGKYVAS